jgi:Leucine-rich repeat (LRR) protein
VPALPHLTYLSLSDTRIRDLASLSALTNLDSLELENTPVDDIGPLAKLRRLRVLKLSSTQVHDITPLRHVKNLEYLELRDTLVNRDQITELQRLLPGCDIRWSQLGAGATPANVAPTAGQVATP